MSTISTAPAGTPGGDPPGGTDPALASTGQDPDLLPMTGTEGGGPEPDGGRAGPRRRRRRLALVLVVVLAAGAAAGITYAVVAGGGGDSTTASGAPTSLATVARTDLVATASYDGTLTYANSRALSASGQGVVTSVPMPGATIVAGQQLFSVNEAPTFLMYGQVPMYRTLQAGVADGADVAQLQADLHALGYDPDGMTIDNTFTTATTDAVNAWKAAVGLPQDGTVTPAEVSFQRGPLHVEATDLTVGQNVTGNAGVLTVTDLSRVVTVQLQSSDAAIAHPGDTVSVALPNGTSVPGTVLSVGQTATAATSSTGGTGTSGTGGAGGASTSGGTVNENGPSTTTSSATVNVTIVMNQPGAAGNFDTAPVTVAFTQQRARGVLAVPVTALLALTGGGYAVQVADPSGATHLAAVTPGLFAANGLVQVSGAGVSAGTRVVVPAGN